MQYLHQLGLLHLLPALADKVVVPPGVVAELEAGRRAGVNLPELTGLSWAVVRAPASQSALPLVVDLGRGEAEVLALGLETRQAVVVIDDSLARRRAKALSLRFTGTLGLILDAKRVGLVPAVSPLIDQLDALGFRLAQHTRQAVLRLADESL